MIFKSIYYFALLIYLFIEFFFSNFDEFNKFCFSIIFWIIIDL
jgi:hypothetical protein